MNAEQGSVLLVDRLSVAYRRREGAFPVVSDVSFRIDAGEAYGLVGESGCGKTTIAMAVMHYLPSNAEIPSGRIAFRGQDLLAASEAELLRLRGDRIAIVYQDPGSALNPSLTVGRQIEEVFHFHARLGKAEAREAASDMLGRVQISDPSGILRRYPHELSGGQQQRVMFAMALATRPDLLVLDEPTTGLDATVEAEVLDLVEQLRASFGAAILFISHNLGIVARVCERVGVLYAGRLIEEGQARTLFADPRHPYTLGLTRCVPRAGMRKHRSRLDPIPGALPSPGSMPPGCVYSPRCPLARDRCWQEAPSLLAAGSTRLSRCFFHQEVPQLPPPPADEVVGPDAAAAEGAGLVLDDFSKHYRRDGVDTVALAGVSLSVRHGEALGVVGESGSGKSTLARCIVGLVEPSGGAASLDGRRLPGRSEQRDAEVRRQIQIVFQNPDTALNPSHTVGRILRRAVRLLSGLRPGPALEERIGALAASVRLSPQHLELRPSSLSGGLKQRVAIARAFAGNPSLVLCDEPTSALDVSVQAAILNLLVDLQALEGVSYVFISHDLGMVRYIADRIAVMYLGEIVEIGPANAIFDPPNHPYTEALISAMPGIGDDGGTARIRLTGTMPSPSRRPGGCPFHTRCPRYLGAICKERMPPWQQASHLHRYLCHIPPADLAAAQHERRQAEIQVLPRTI